MAGTAPLPKLDEVAEGDSTTAPPPRSRITTSLSGIERFTMIRRLGEGGMGCVYEAYDSTLDRKVAVKLVRADRRRSGDPIEPRDQLLREAQAMARLAHPNVVAVHEVGEIGEDIYVVLELVDGTTLRDWLRERPRTWRAKVDAFAQAGRGLAAAHEAGLVHRDFKPINTLVRRDGRIQVTDFGVASMGGSTRDSSLSGSGTESTAVGEITYANRRVGTPAYMSPEQHAMGAIDGRADQFSFCVALWEALYGIRPFASLPDQIHKGQIVEPPASAKVPRWLQAPLRRGLSPRAEDRWPSMEDLLAQLARDPARTRRRRLAIAGIAAALATIGVVAWAGWTRQPAAVEPCSGADALLVGRWDPARAAAVRGAFRASGAPYAEAAAARVTAQLDSWAPRWVAMRADVCRATRISGEQSEALLDARTRCLDRQLDEVSQLVGALVTSDRGVISRAAESLALPELAACADREAVLTRVPTTAVARERVGQIEHELGGIRTAERIGRYHDARMRAVALSTEVAKLDVAPLGAETLLVRGQLEEQDGDLAAARATLVEATRLAAIAKDDRTLAEAMISLIGVLVSRAEVPAALALGIAADAATARAGDPDLAAQLAEQLGAAHDAAGDTEAETHLRHALALRETADPDSVAVAQVLNKLAGLDGRRGRTSDARLGYERALRIVTARLGPQHPATAIAHANVCFLDAEAGKLAAARACQEDVLVVLESALGRDHPQVAWALNEVGLVQRTQGELAAAEQRFERALAIWEHASGKSHPDVAWPLINLGELANGRRDHVRAEALCRRAVAVLEKTAELDAVPALACLAEATLENAPKTAAAAARRALDALRTREHAADPAIAFTLARALAASGGRAEATAVARGALVDATGPLRQQIESWLARR